MEKTGNPAGKLYKILDTARNLDTKSNRNVRAQLGVLFNISNFDTDEGLIEIIHRLNELFKLAEETEQALREISNLNLNLYLREIPKIKSTIVGLMAAPNAEWNVYRQNINAIEFTVLEFCSDQLSQIPAENSVSKEELKKILAEIEDAYSSINESNLPHELKAFLLDQLESIRRAIHEYSIRGLRRLKEQLSTTLGAIIINQDLLETAVNTKEVGKFKKVVSYFGKLVDFALKIKPLADPFIKHYLGSGDSGEKSAAE
jgi:hypothetical protein